MGCKESADIFKRVLYLYLISINSIILLIRMYYVQSLIILFEYIFLPLLFYPGVLSLGRGAFIIFKYY